LDENGIDDACELCPPEPALSSSDPPNNTTDARQPHPPNSAATRQGIGSATEPIRVSMLPRLADLENCFSVCETNDDPVLGENEIQSVVYEGNGVYQIVLDHAIPAGAASTIEYVGSQTFVQYFNHPGNVDNNSVVNSSDVSKLLACCLGHGNCLPPALPTPNFRRCDIDRSGANTALDLLRLMDVLIGSDDLLPWNNTPKPTNTTCPP
jgi:hypothetical protein